MKPIEPGCMAWTYNCRNPENNGKVVKCIKFVIERPPEFGPSMFSNNFWLTDGFFWSVDQNGNKAIPMPYAHESTLLRIDGYEDDKTIEEITKELTA